MAKQTPEDAALDALAAALAPRLLREVRALLAAEAAEEDQGGVAMLAAMGYALGPCPSSNPSRTDKQRTLKRPKPRPRS